MRLGLNLSINQIVCDMMKIKKSGQNKGFLHYTMNKNQL